MEKTSKIIRIFALALAGGLTLMSCNKTDPVSTYSVTEGKPDYSLKAKENVFRIGAWVAPPSANWNNMGNPNYITDANYQDVADSGINMMYALYEIGNRSATKTAADLAAAKGIKYLARDYAVDVDPVKLEYEQGDMHQATQLYDGSAGFNGFLVHDEPGADEFDRLGSLKKYYDKEYPGKEFYVNLFPSYASLSQIQANSYGEYLDQYIAKVKPDFVSYDHYALSKDGYGKYHITEDVLWNLEMVANRCKKAGIPMYTFVASMQYDGSSRDPDEKDIRWQVMTELAYGSRSIQYFCYWTPIESSFSSYVAMITADGKKTDRYGYVQTVNKEIAGVDEALLDFSWEGTLPVKGKDVTTLNKPFAMLETPLTSIAGISNIQTSQDSLIGAFKGKDGRDGYFITNFSEPRDGKSDAISLSFNGANSALVYHYGKAETVALKNSVFTYSLDAGDGIFVVPYK